MGNIMDVKFRRYMYRIAVAVGVVLVTYGVINSEQLTVWLAVALAVLGLTADANVGELGVQPRRALDDDNE